MGFPTARHWDCYENKSSELSCSYLTSISVLGGSIILADWVRFKFWYDTLFVPVSLSLYILIKSKPN